ncbi:Bug family tripartite tricarboxylate transporter substrate binding protein [Alcaligenes faecalis]|uniref:Bug family tripartite tricarboxylate transporter substrate binding protein n=1 Tax=Alcaligenes faecalis TaxID=511 RepID=UPI001F0C12B8|nr:tripartite tricarboxylate transporter substrate binding protein [Alcaligenes faecalis]
MKKMLGLAMAGWAALMMIAGTAQATTFPAQPVRLIVPFGAGGITDLVARLLAQQLGKELDQTVIVENKAGAGGMIAAQVAQNAKADGYTVFMGTVGTQVVNPLLVSKINYDPLAFVPIGMVTGSPYVLAVRSDLGTQTYAQLVSHARQEPGLLNFGSAGVGSSPHLGIELFKLTEKLDVRHIPFKSGGEAVSAVVGHHADMVMDAIPVIMPQVKAGKLRALVLADSQRSPAAPEVPSSAELGVPELRISSWNVLLAPPGTPPQIVAVLETALQKALADPQFKAHLEQQGSQVYTGTQDEYQHFIAAERSKWQRLVQTAEISLE